MRLAPGATAGARVAVGRRPAPVVTARAAGDGNDAATPARALHVALDMGQPILPSHMSLLSPAERSRLDARLDNQFQAAPFTGYHVDAAFRQRLTALYRQSLQPGTHVLDLCSSAHSHLPPASELPLGRVAGLGLSAAELAANPRLDTRDVHDLNSSAALPYTDGAFQAVLCCCGLMYLVYPEVVVSEIARVLAPGGVVVLSFSSHCYPDKAIAAWLQRTPEQRVALVRALLLGAGFTNFELHANAASRQTDSSSGQPAKASQADPFYAVTAKAAAPVSGVPQTRIPPSVEPADLAKQYVSPPLREIELLRSGQEHAGVRPETLERWVEAYAEMSHDAVKLGIPRDAIPALPEQPTAEQIRGCRNHLQDMIASFMSSGL